MTLSREKYLGSIWFWWFITTTIYVTIDFINPPSIFARAEPLTLVLDIIARVLGLFVPFGLLSLFSLLSPFGWLGLIAALVGLMYANKHLRATQMSLGKKIGLIFLALFLITFVSDLARFTPFGSFKILINGFNGLEDF